MQAHDNSLNVDLIPDEEKDPIEESLSNDRQTTHAQGCCDRRLAVDDLIERLRAVKWEEVYDDDRIPDDPTHKCVLVDMRPDDFRALLRETADALDNGLNPVGCPDCESRRETERELREWIERGRTEEEKAMALKWLEDMRSECRDGEGEQKCNFS